jgi:catechol 2,3-dioxygenase-like lactoylglutathione lyase family enzyme
LVVGSLKRRRNMDMKLELIILPVSDADRAKAFYEKAGFNVDVDHKASEDFRVIQVTPPGSACSVSFGKGISKAEPGSIQGLHLVVNDLEAALAELTGREIEVSEPFHFGAAGQTPGLHPERSDYGSYGAFSDPDGNGWLVQEVGYNV